MNLTGLLVLGLLADDGPSHGHQLRRRTEEADAERWSGVGVGSLHRELRRLEGEGLIAALRTEKVGNRPERTVYEITDEGRRALSTLRRQAFAEVARHPDPISVALVFAPPDGAELAQLMATHEQAVRAEVARLAAERTRGETEGFLRDPLQAASFRRAELRVQAELAWHEEWNTLP